MGVDAARFTPARRDPRMREMLLRKAGASGDTALLLYAGRLAPEKNLPLLLQTMHVLGPHADCVLLIAGDGPDRPGFLREAARLAPGRVVHLDHETDRVRLASLFANVDAFLHPNPREPFGIAPLEAMSAGTALVAPDSGGVTAYANHRNAWITEATPAAFAAAVCHILRDPRERELRTGEARRTAERLNWPNVGEDFHALYQDLYARVQGSPTRFEPAFYSTPGNWLGFEIPSTTSL
jgi:alpha-1,6-mannosyltransferase